MDISKIKNVLLGKLGNLLENVVYLTIFFIGIIAYDKHTRNPIIIEAIKTETTKIETNIDSKIDNKFKKIDELNTKLDNSFSTIPTQILDASKPPKDLKAVKREPCPTLKCPDINCPTIESDEIPEGYVVMKIENLTRRQKKRLGL